MTEETITIATAVRRANKSVFVDSKATVVTKALTILGVAYEAAHNFSCAIFDSKKSITALVKRFFEAEAEKAEAARAAEEAEKARLAEEAAKKEEQSKFLAVIQKADIGGTASGSKYAFIYESKGRNHLKIGSDICKAPRFKDRRDAFAHAGGRDNMPALHHLYVLTVSECQTRETIVEAVKRQDAENAAYKAKMKKFYAAAKK